MRGLKHAAVALAAATLVQGCAANSKTDPGARALPMGSSCDSIRGELNKLDGRGVPALVERSSAGGKLNAQQKSDVDRYNGLLNQYLGARCHI